MVDLDCSQNSWRNLIPNFFLYSNNFRISKYNILLGLLIFNLS